jgi:hypothetical protein
MSMKNKNLEGSLLGHNICVDARRQTAREAMDREKRCPTIRHNIFFVITPLTLAVIVSMLAGFSKSVSTVLTDPCIV